MLQIYSMMMPTTAMAEELQKHARQSHLK
uniref:Uncharacterized protein n=1 Tax=Arundo donax TaxID=35708 RepID=A0A0A9G130_ARUDO